MTKIYYTYTDFVVMLVCIVTLFLSACARPPHEYQNNQSLGLEEAVTALGQNLKFQFDKSQQNEIGQIHSIVIDPILSVEGGQQFKANQQVVSILAQGLGPGFKMDEITPETLANAKYVLAGALSQHPNSSDGIKSSCELVITILELPSGMVKAKGKIRIWDFPFEQLAFYEDSPIFLMDKNVRLAKSLFGLVIGRSVSPEYLQFLPVKARIQIGISSYEHQRYADAATSFSESVLNPNGKTLTSYAGLYLSSEKLHREDAANHAFANLLSIAIEENHHLDIRLLFSVNSPVFIPNPELMKRYAWWLKHIALHMKKSYFCLNISGHSSRSGDERYNERLSLSRAKTVQNVLAVTYPGIIKKSHADGKGYKENIIGTGADDASDAVDRRVEFSFIDCNELLQLNKIREKKNSIY
jgi:outer membrane protein OmpA-like peptidoglycan-associated protein